MGEEGIKDFTINWILGGLLMFCLLTFATMFIYNNNSMALNDGTEDIFNEVQNLNYNKLTSVSENSNELSNMTSNTNPEVSDLGSRDSVAFSFKTKESSLTYWENSKKLILWVFSGDSGKIILGTVGGMLGFLVLFYIWRFIRNGL